jgi:hypothetical protein
VKIFFGTSKPVMGSSTDSSTQVWTSHRRSPLALAEEREKHAHNKDTKSAKLELLGSVRLICHDPKATKLDMQRLQKDYRFKPMSNYY